MKLISKIRNGFKRLPRRTVVSMVGLGLLLSVPAAFVVAEFYPDRTPFDYNKPCNPNDGDIYDRCGSLTGPVFNSFINTPSYGDERAFLDARRSDQTTGDVYKNVLTNVTEGSKEVVVRMYVHNNANQDTNASGLGVAKNTKVRVLLPTATDDTLRARGYISADNATPNLVEDTVDFVGSEEFSLSYVPGSARLYDNDNFKSGVQVSDSIVTTGAPIGTDALDGNMKGCFEYEAVVEIKVKVTPKKVPQVKFEKNVGIAGKDGWGELVSVKPGDKVKWLVTYQNTGNVDHTNVKVNDKLPPHVELVPGTVRYIDAAQDVVQQDAPFFTTGGINFGTWKPNGGFYVRFETTAKDDFEGCEVVVRNIARATSDQHGQVEDEADVKITKPNCVEENPVYRCELLKAEKISDRAYRFTTETTALGGATVKQYRYNFGDNSPEFVTDKKTVEHTFPSAGSFVTTVTVDFNVDGQVKSHTSEKCKTAITIDKPGQPPVLPSTGPADLVGIFAATTFAGAIAHRVVWNRKGLL